MEMQLRSSTIAVQILINGQPMPFYRRQHDSMPFVEAQLGQTYVIRITPIKYERLEVVSSVDGRNTLKNEPAHPVRNRGMVVKSTFWDIKGFRISDTETAQFIFNDPMAAVSTVVTGSVGNTGVIGLAVYREYQRPVYRDLPQGLESMAMRGDGVKGLTGAERSDAGTASGATLYDPVGHTSFTRDSDHPVDFLAIHYRTRGWLEQNGIIVSDDPNPWPGLSDTGYQFLRR